jgi:TP901 family phage tail tape measure protein
MDGFIKPSLDEAKSFETEMSMLKFVTKGTADQMEHLRGVAIQTGLATQFSPQETASGIRMLKAAGLETEKALESLNATLDITTGSAGMLGLQEGASGTAAALLKFKGTGETAAEIADAFAQSTRETNMQFKDFLGVIDAMRDAPAKLQMTAAQAFALAGVMRSAGLSTRSAGLNVSMFAERLILAQRRVSRYLRKAKITEKQLFDPTYFDEKMPDVAFQFKRMGVHLFETNGQLKDATKLLMEMTDRARELKGESQKAFLETISSILGPRSSAVLMALVNFKKGSLEGSAAFEKLVRSLETSPGAAREAAEAIEQTTAGMEKFIEGTEKTIQNIIGTTFLPVLKEYHMILRKVLNSVLAFLEKNPAVAKALGYTAVAFYVLSKIVAVVAGFLAIAVVAFMTIGPAIMKAGGAAVVATAGLAALKFVLIGLAVVAGVVLGLFLLIRGAIWAWNKIWSSEASGLALDIQNLLKDLSLLWKGLKALIKTGELDETLYNELAVEGLLGTLVAIYLIGTRVKEMWKGIKEGFSLVIKPLDFFLGLIGDALGWIISKFNELLEGWTGTRISKHINLWKILGWVIGGLLAASLTVVTLLAIAMILPFALLGVMIWGIVWVVIKLYQWFSKLVTFLDVVIDAVKLFFMDVENIVKIGGENMGTELYEAFKRAFGSVFDYIKKAWDLATTVWGRIKGTTTSADVDKAWENLVRGPTVSEGQLSASESLDAMANAPRRTSSAMMASRAEAAIAKREGRDKTFNQEILAELRSKRMAPIHIDKIELSADKATPAEAEKLAKYMMERIAKVQDNDAESEFSQGGG